MAQLTSNLTIRLNDDVSGPAGKAAGALQRLGASGADLKKLAAATPEAARLARELEKLQAQADKINAFRAASKGLGAAGNDFRLARQDVARLTGELARARSGAEALKGVRGGEDARRAAAATVRRLERDLRAAGGTLAQARGAFREQGVAVRAMRRELLASGVELGGFSRSSAVAAGRSLNLGKAQDSLKAAIESTNAALARQPALMAQAEARASTVAARAMARTAAARSRQAAEAVRPVAAREAAAAIEAARLGRSRARAAADALPPPVAGAVDPRRVPALAGVLAERERLQARAAAIAEFRAQQRDLKAAGLASRLAGQDVRARRADLDAAPTPENAGRLAQAQAAAVRAAEGLKAQAQAAREARAALAAVGVDLGRLRATEAGLVGAIDGATAAVRRQAEALGQVAARAASAASAEERLARGMASAGRQTAARIEHSRRLSEGMGAQARAVAQAAEAERKAVEKSRETRRTDRREVAGTIGAATGLAAGSAAKRIGKEAVVSIAEFDIATRKQRVFTDISAGDQAVLQAQAKRIGQETQYSNLDVVKAQTASMQGLPEGFAPSLKAAVAHGIVEHVRDYATLMDTDLNVGAETIRSYLQQTGKDISTKEKALAESQKATNQLVKMSKLGGMNGEDVSGFLKFAASSGTTAGLSTDSLLSLAALARRGGLRGDEAGTFIRATASKLVSPTGPGIAALNAAGIKHSNFVRMPDRLSTEALEGQFQNKLGKSFTPAVRQRLDAINADKALVSDRAKYVEAVTSAVAPILGKTKAGAVRASDSRVAAKATGDFYKVSAQSVDVEGLLDAMMSSGMTLAQLNAVLTDKHGGKGAITQRQYDDYKAAREAIKKAGDDPDFARKKAKEVMDGVGGAFENLKGSIDNFYLSVGAANEALIKFASDSLGSAVDQFSKMPQPAQQAATLALGAGAVAASAAGAVKMTRLLLGLTSTTALSGSAVALTGSAALLDGSAAALSAAAARLGVGGAVPSPLKGSVPSTATKVAEGAAPAALGAGLTVGGVITGATIVGGALAGAILDSATPGTGPGLIGTLKGEDDPGNVGKLAAAVLRAREAEAAAARVAGSPAPAGWQDGTPKRLPGAVEGRGFTSSMLDPNQGAISRFLEGQRKLVMDLPAMPQAVPRAPLSAVLPAPAPPGGVPAAAGAERAAATRREPIVPKQSPETVAPRVDTSSVDGLGAATKTALGGLNDLNTTVSPQVDTSGLVALTNLLGTILGQISSVNTGIASAKSAAASITVPAVSAANQSAAARTGPPRAVPRLGTMRSGAFSDVG